MAATIIISVLLAALVAWILVRAVRNRKSGKSSCGNNCSCCPMGGACHSACGSPSHAEKSEKAPQKK